MPQTEFDTISFDNLRACLDSVYLKLSLLRDFVGEFGQDMQSLGMKPHQQMSASDILKACELMLKIRSM